MIDRKVDNDKSHSNFPHWTSEYAVVDQISGKIGFLIGWFSLALQTVWLEYQCLSIDFFPAEALSSDYIFQMIYYAIFLLDIAAQRFHLENSMRGKKRNRRAARSNSHRRVESWKSSKISTNLLMVRKMIYFSLFSPKFHSRSSYVVCEFWSWERASSTRKWTSSSRQSIDCRVVKNEIHCDTCDTIEQLVRQINSNG